MNSEGTEQQTPAGDGRNRADRWVPAGEAAGLQNLTVARSEAAEWREQVSGGDSRAALSWQMSGEAEDSVTWLIRIWNSSVGFASRALHLDSWPQPPDVSAVQCVVQCVLCCVCLYWTTSGYLCCAVCTSRMPRDLITTVPWSIDCPPSHKWSHHLEACTSHISRIIYWPTWCD